MATISWLQNHLESFVRPVLGFIPQLTSSHIPFFTPQEMSVMKNMWRAVKCQAGDRRILLAGRDVFVFEILARREGFPTTFRPDISRKTARHIKEDYKDHFLFDTGFVGSIPRALGMDSFTLASSNLANGYLGQALTPLSVDVKQIFPRLRGARSLALKIERTPKYWHGAFHREYCPHCVDVQVTYSYFWSTSSYKECPNCAMRYANEVTLPSKIGQELSSIDEFERAALLTIEVYKDSSPRFSSGSLPSLRRSLW